MKSDQIFAAALLLFAVGLSIAGIARDSQHGGFAAGWGSGAIGVAAARLLRRRDDAT